MIPPSARGLQPRERIVQHIGDLERKRIWNFKRSVLVTTEHLSNHTNKIREDNGNSISLEGVYDFV